MLLTELLAGTPDEVLTRTLELSRDRRRELVPELTEALHHGRETVALDDRTWGARDAELAAKAALVLLTVIPPGDRLLREVLWAQPESLPRVLLARPEQERAALAARLVAYPAGWQAVRELVRAGELAPVRNAEYHASWFHWSGTGGQRPLAERLRAEPGALAEVWELLEVEGSGDGSFAAFDKYVPEQNRWATALVDLSRTGELDREWLLRLTLDVLGRDFAAFRAQWYAALHEALAPTPAERAVSQPVYARLCGSSLPRTVSFAVKALAAVQKAGLLDAEVALPHLSAAAAGRGAGTAKQALRIAVKAGRPALAAEVFEAALGHESAEVRELAGAQLGAERAAPVKVEPVSDYPEPEREPFARRRLLQVALEVPDSPAAVAEAFSSLLADYYQADLVLAALDGVHRHAADLAPALKPLLKRAAKADAEHNQLMQKLLGRLVQGLAGREVVLPEPKSRWPRVLRHRMAALLAGNATPVSAATHLGGWLNPVVFVRRLLACPEANQWDVVDGLLRLAPDTRAEALELAAGLTGPCAEAVRFGLGGPQAPAADWLGMAAARAREPEAADPAAVLRGEAPAVPVWSARVGHPEKYPSLTWLYHSRSREPEKPDLPWLGMAHQPPENYEWEGFTDPHEAVGSPYDRAWIEAGVARDLFENDFEVGYPSEVVGLAPYLDRPATPSYPGLLMLAASLNTQRASGAQLGVDAVLSLWDARLLGPRALGQALAVYGNELTLTRLSKRLTTLAGEHPAAVLSTVDALLPALDRAVRGLSAVLELAVDLAERGAGALSADTRQWLAGLSGSSKAAKAASRLLR